MSSRIIFATMFSILLVASASVDAQPQEEHDADAAVFGQVTVEGAGDLDGPVEAEIRPEGSGWRDAVGGERLGHLFRKVEVDRRGYFQFRDLTPGSYHVEARAAGRARAVRAAIDVQEGRETDLGPPLVLRPPARLELHLDPLEAPDGERWTVRLSPVDASSDAHVTRVDWTGFGLVDGLAPGTYRYLVTSRGSTWSTGEVDVSGDVTVATIEIPLVAVEGIVRRGDEPARARIVFGGSHEHPERIEMFADPEGRSPATCPAKAAGPRSSPWRLAAPSKGSTRWRWRGRRARTRPGSRSTCSIPPSAAA